MVAGLGVLEEEGWALVEAAAWVSGQLVGACEGVWEAVAEEWKKMVGFARQVEILMSGKELEVVGKKVIASKRAAFGVVAFEKTGLEGVVLKVAEFQVALDVTAIETYAWEGAPFGRTALERVPFDGTGVEKVLLDETAYEGVPFVGAPFDETAFEKVPFVETANEEIPFDEAAFEEVSIEWAAFGRAPSE